MRKLSKLQERERESEREGGEGGRERERERETERQRDRETETERQREIDRDRETETQRDRDRESKQVSNWILTDRETQRECITISLILKSTNPNELSPVHSPSLIHPYILSSLLPILSFFLSFFHSLRPFLPFSF